jgi:hypothetical protein
MNGEIITLRVAFENARAENRLPWKVCEVCGQALDTADQEEVFYHGPEHHPPMPLTARAGGPPVDPGGAFA